MLRGTAVRAHRVALINKLDVDGFVIEPKHTTARFVGCLTGERCSGDAECEQCGRTRRSRRHQSVRDRQFGPCVPRSPLEDGDRLERSDGDAMSSYDWPASAELNIAMRTFQAPSSFLRTITWLKF